MNNDHFSWAGRKYLLSLIYEGCWARGHDTVNCLVSGMAGSTLFSNSFAETQFTSPRSTRLKCTVQWCSVQAGVQPPRDQFQTARTTPEGQPSRSLPTSCPWQRPAHFPSPRRCLFWTFMGMEPAGGSSGPNSLTQHRVFRVQPRCT